MSADDRRRDAATDGPLVYEIEENPLPIQKTVGKIVAQNNRVSMIHLCVNSFIR